MTPAQQIAAWRSRGIDVTEDRKGKKMPKRLLPDRIHLGHHHEFSVSHITHALSGHRGEGERLMRFILPPFQRPAVWNRNQQIRFMESLILGMPIGTYSYSSNINKPKTDGWLIDGQQRIRAIEQYLLDEFAVFGFRWSELTQPDQMRVQNMNFGAYVLHDASEQELLERYIALNYSGTPHTESDKRRAKRMLAKATS